MSRDPVLPISLLTLQLGEQAVPWQSDEQHAPRISQHDKGHSEHASRARSPATNAASRPEQHESAISRKAYRSFAAKRERYKTPKPAPSAVAPPADRDHARVWHEGQRRQYYTTFPSVTKTSSATIVARVNSPTSHREQLFASFFDDIPWDQVDKTEILSTLQSWFAHPGKATRAATDCLMAIQLAQRTQNEAHRRKAQEYHGKALRGLHRTLQDKDAASSDDVLYATDAMGICETYGDLTFGPDAWRQHARGLGLILAARGPSCLQATGTFRYFIANAIYTAASDAIMNRKASVLGTGPWLRKMEETCTGRFWCILRIDSELPALLESCDRLTQALDGSIGSCMDLIERLNSMEEALHRWLEAWRMDEPAITLQPVNMADYLWFLSKMGVACHAFTHAVRFPSTTAAFGYLQYWWMLLVIRESIYSLADHHSLASTISVERKEEYAKNVYEMADSLSRCVPSFLDIYGYQEDWISGRAPGAASGFMGGPEKWYVARGDLQKVAYCRFIAAGTLPGRIGGPTTWSSSGGGNELMMGDRMLAARFYKHQYVGPHRCICRSATAEEL